MIFLGISSIQWKTRHDQPSDIRQSTSRSDRPVGHPWSVL